MTDEIKTEVTEEITSTEAADGVATEVAIEATPVAEVAETEVKEG